MKRHLIRVMTFLVLVIIAALFWLKSDGDLSTSIIHDRQSENQVSSGIHYADLIIGPNNPIGPFSISLLVSADLELIHQAAQAISQSDFKQTPLETLQVMDASGHPTYMLIMGEYNGLSLAKKAAFQLENAFSYQPKIIRLPLEMLTSVGFMHSLNKDEPSGFSCHEKSYNWDYETLNKAVSYFKEYQSLKKTHGWNDQTAPNSIFHQRAKTELKLRVLEALNAAQKTYQGSRSAELFAMLDVSEKQITAHSLAFKQNLPVFTRLNRILDALNLQPQQSQFLTCYFQVAKFGLLAANALIEKSSVFRGVLIDFKNAQTNRDVALSENQMRDYLQTQYSRFQVIAEYAYPYMQGFTQSENAFIEHPLVATWQKNFEDIKDYEFSKSGDIAQVYALYEQLNIFYKTGNCNDTLLVDLKGTSGLFVSLKQALFKELEKQC